MVDYDKKIGTNGTMRIRDTGTYVEFWLHSSSPYTWNSALPYGWTINGSSGSSTFNWTQGSGWRRLRRWNVQYSQDVTFKLGNTGTQSFGGPHTFTKYVERATARVRSGGTWKTAIPYVRTGGVWKIAQAWVRSGGNWKIGG